MSNLMEYMIQIADQIRELQEDADKKMEVILKEIALIQAKLHELHEENEYNSNIDKYIKRK
jgi:vacuolar-type H+-ATPase subunit D/Vma8